MRKISKRHKIEVTLWFDEPVDKGFAADCFLQNVQRSYNFHSTSRNLSTWFRISKVSQKITKDLRTKPEKDEILSILQQIDEVKKSIKNI